MRVIDLLNKIANGEEVPEKFKYEDMTYIYRYDLREYFDDKELNRDFIGIELDKEYYEIAKNRINGITADGQLSIFTDVDQMEQQQLFE